jgi:hypothetical protein
LIFQKHDNAEAIVIQDKTKAKNMKTSNLKTNWLVPLLGIVVVAGSLWGVTTYLDLERLISDDQILGTTVDRLYVDHQLSAVLKTIHDGKVDEATKALDLLLCESILRIDADVEVGNARARTYAQEAFRRIATVRPKTATATDVASAQEGNSDTAAAEKILSLAAATISNARP